MVGMMVEPPAFFRVSHPGVFDGRTYTNGNHDERRAANLEYSEQFAYCLVVFTDMLQDMAAIDEIEMFVRKLKLPQIHFFPGKSRRQVDADIRDVWES